MRHRAATARRFAEEGAGVALVDLDEVGCKAVAEEIASGGAESLALTCDVSDAKQVQQMVDQTLERFGQLHILVNNAGILRDNLVFKMTDDDWDRVIGVHLRGAFLCARAAQKPMVERKYGRIISLSSTSALGNRGQINYSAAKAGLQGLTRTLAIELGPFGITANAIAPGFIDTDMTRSTAERLGATQSSSRRSCRSTFRCAASASRARSPVWRRSSPPTTPALSAGRSSTSPAALLVS